MTAYKETTMCYIKLASRDMVLRDETVIAIAKGDLHRVEESLKSGFPVNMKLRLARDGRPRTMPIMIAILAENIAMIDLLIRYGAKLDNGLEHAFLYACMTRNLEVMRYVAKLGAELNCRDAQGYNAYDHIVEQRDDFERIKASFELLEELGAAVREEGGAALRSCISHLAYQGQGEVEKEIVHYLLEKEVDVDYHQTNESYKEKNITALMDAAYYGYLDGVKQLVEHGADLTIEGPLGRPYIAACQAGNHEIAAYLREKEDPKLHDRAYLMDFAKEKNMPKELIQFLEQERPKLQYQTEEGEQAEVEFLNFMELYEYKIKRTTYIVLANQIDEYEKYLLWHPKKKKICFYDVEMKEYGEFAGFEKFFKDPFHYLQGMLEGNYVK